MKNNTIWTFFVHHHEICDSRTNRGTGLVHRFLHFVVRIVNHDTKLARKGASNLRLTRPLFGGALVRARKCNFLIADVIRELSRPSQAWISCKLVVGRASS